MEIEYGHKNGTGGRGVGNRKSRPRNRSRCWFFTAVNATADMVAQFTKYFTENELDYVFQMEQGRDAGMTHLQGVIRYKNPRDNWPELQAHWERCRNWKQAVKYCSKLDTRIDGPWSNIEGLTFRETIRDPMHGLKFRWWQQKVMNILTQVPDDRTIHWYWDEGNSGKTSLVKHIVLKYGKKILPCMGASRDIFKLLADRLDNDIDIKAVFFLLTRSDTANLSYRALEGIKDGIVVSTKYEPIDLIFNSPHVFVFANFPPDLSKLTQDRWDVCYTPNMISWEPYLAGTI